jgi:hypothetical protein
MRLRWGYDGFGPFSSPTCSRGSVRDLPDTIASLTQLARTFYPSPALSTRVSLLIGHRVLPGFPVPISAYFIEPKDFWRICQSLRPLNFSPALALSPASLAFLVGFCTL